MAFLDTTDALDRRVVVPGRPQRIVSLVPSQTELLADLGLEDEVLGLTRFCVYPDGWKARKAIVGGTKSVNLDRVAALAPDLILANKEENERDQIEALAALAPVYVTDVATVQDGLAMIRAVGTLTGHVARADTLADEIDAGFAVLGQPTPVRVAYLIWREPWMAAGGDTYISDVLRRAGLLNVFADRTRYPEVSLQAIRDAGAKAVLLSSEPYPFQERHLAEVQDGSGVPTLLINGEVCSWYGSRMRFAPAYLADFRRRLLDAIPP